MGFRLDEDKDEDEEEEIQRALFPEDHGTLTL